MSNGDEVESSRNGWIEERSTNDGCNGEIPMMSPLASSENAKHRIIRTAMLLHARLMTLLHFKNKHTDDYNYHPDSLPPAWLLSLLALLNILGVSSPGRVRDSGRTDSS